MKITRRFTKADQNVFATVEYDKRTSRISNPDGSIVFEMNDAEIPRGWSQLATDIMVSKYFRKAGVPQVDTDGNPKRDAQGNVIMGPEKSARQVINRLAGCWRHWGETHGYFDTTEDAQAFYDELSYMLLNQMCAPNSPQWFNTGLNWAYGITGPAQGHYYCDPRTGELLKSKDAYSHPQPHACQPFRAPVSTPTGPVPIGRIVKEKLIGLEVFDGTDEGNGITRVIAVKENGEKLVFRVLLDGGAMVEATGDHLMYALTSDGTTGRWVRLDSLERGMEMLQSVRDREAERAMSTSPLAASFGLEAVAECHAADGMMVRRLRPVRVRRIEPLGMHTVFDIQTESGQYLSNHVIIHNCFIQSVSDDLVNAGGIMDLWTREARLFKYGSGTGSNFSKVRGENEALSGGGKSSGLMSFLKIGDRAAGAIKSGGTTRRAAKMVCLDLDHPDVEQFINWKVREELKVACLAEGIKHIAGDQQELAKKLGLKLDYDFNGEAYYTVSGQNSNNSVRIPNSFFKAVEEDGNWNLTNRINGKTAKTIKARELWDQIAFAAWRCADPGVQYDDTINQWHTCPASGRINASNPCVTGDTRVLTPGGIWRRIDQMIHLPARVITNLHSQEIHVTDGSFPTGTRDIFELRTDGGYSLKLTGDHKVWTRSRGWVAAMNLTTDDEVRLPGKPAAVHEIGDPQDPRFFQLLGMFLSEANSDPCSLKLNTCLSQTQASDEFAQYVAQTWGDGGSYSGDYQDDSSFMTERGEGSAPTLTAPVTHRRLISRMNAFVRTEAGQCRLSDEAFTSGLAAQKHFLRGLFTADGVITVNSLELKNSNPGLLQDIQLILLGFGVQSAITTQQNDGGAVESGALHDGQVRTTPPGRDDLGSRGYANEPRHGLRIDPGSLRSFGKYVGLVPGKKLDRLSTLIPLTISSSTSGGNFDRFASLIPIGRQQVFDLTEPETHSFVAGGITVHNCSEYMFLDDTACNLASLNVLTFFDAETRSFDIEAFRHGCRIWTIVLEISVLMASFPSEEIAELSYKFRTLGLGYANLGAMLMQAGIAYDSERGRAVCAALSSILTGESYATSAEMAKELGAFPGYFENKPHMLRVIRNHRRAAYNVDKNTQAAGALGTYEQLDIHPVGIDAREFSDTDPLSSSQLLKAARECWDRALSLGEKHGYRNAQTTVIAPTGTIGLLMDCDTTGVEPDFALVKFKKLSGGGYFKIANQSVRPALVNFGYTPEQIHDILRYCLGTLTLHDAPHLNWLSLKEKGLTPQDLQKIESSLPGQFEISFAFSGWSLGADTMNRLSIPESEWQAKSFSLLRRLGYTRKQIEAANDVICGRGTVEGAPHLKLEHYSVFDCANKCGRHGTRFIHVDGHIRMMAAAQPFITGAISKTINLPNEATIEEIKQSYQLSWELGLKSNALYRDGSKLSQPLNVKSDKDIDDLEEDDAENVESARQEIARLTAGVAASAATASTPVTADNIEPTHVKVIEKIIERIVERPLRRRLPDTRNALTHKFDVAGHEGYLTVGLYHDNQPGEVFITMAKEGSTIGGLMDAIATLVSVSLQYGVPVESLVRKFEHVRFEPSGMTRNPEIPMAKSLVDYIFRWLAMEFIPGYRAANAPQRAQKKPVEMPPQKTPEPFSEGPINSEAARGLTTKTTNGHGPRIDADTTQPFAYTDAELKSAAQRPAPDPGCHGGTSALRLQIVADPLSQQGTEMQSDAPACDVCGSITVRSGTCYKCLNCGNSMGCS